MNSWKNLIESGKIREVLQSSVGVVWETRCAVIHSPWYRTAKPVDVPAASVVSSMKRYRDLLRRPSLGRYSTSYESYRAAASMLLPFLIKSLVKKEKKKKNRKRKRERKIGLAEWDWFLNLKLRLFATGVLDRVLLTWSTLDMFQFPSIWNSCLPNSKLLCHNCEGQHNLKTTY